VSKRPVATGRKRTNADYCASYYRTLKRLVLARYGTRCKCCKESGEDFLTIDHISGMGNLHRSVVGAGKSFYCWLKARGFPKGYQTLCFNCNHAKHTRGVCPHRRKGAR
jgi:hypothetical protein